MTTSSAERAPELTARQAGALRWLLVLPGHRAGGRRHLVHGSVWRALWHRGLVDGLTGSIGGPHLTARGEEVANTYVTSGSPLGLSTCTWLTDRARS